MLWQILFFIDGDCDADTFSQTFPLGRDESFQSSGGSRLALAGSLTTGRLLDTGGLDSGDPLLQLPVIGFYILQLDKFPIDIFNLKQRQE